jgi:PKD repeat protein
VTVKLVTTNQSGTATITAYSGGASKTITIDIGTAAANRVQVTANPQTLGSLGGTSLIQALVTDKGGSPVGGIPVTFTTDQGSLSASTAITDTNGVATTSVTTAATATVTVTAGSVTAQTVKVNVGVKSLASFTANPTSGSAGTPIAFTITPGTGANLSNVRVNFGDGFVQDTGPISAATTVTHAYNSPGNYTATATATDASGSAGSLSTNVLIGSAAIVLIASPTSVTLGSPITFTVSGLGTGAQVDHYSWTFDDGGGTNTSGPQITHVFNSRGTHFASVQVFGVGGGLLGTAQTAVTIQ